MEADRKVVLKENERVDDLQRNGYQIIQNPEKFCFGMDAVLLSGFAKAKEGSLVLDMGTGTGIIPILMEAKTKAAHLTGLEIQKESADMARRSVSLNGLEEKISIVTGDIKEAGSLFRAASFDVITCNPPYMIGQHGLTNPGDANQYKLEPKRMQMVYPFVDKEPNMVLIESNRGGKPRMTVERPLIIYKEQGVYMPEIYDIYGY